MQSLIEQVKRLAEAQSVTDVAYADYERGVNGPDAVELYGIHERAFNERSGVMDATDFPALLAHLVAQQAVVDAARKLEQHLIRTYPPSALELSPTGKLLGELGNALAALNQSTPKRSDNDAK